eukprot:c28529_g3_i2 orf=420-794(+)
MEELMRALIKFGHEDIIISNILTLESAQIKKFIHKIKEEQANNSLKISRLAQKPPSTKWSIKVLILIHTYSRFTPQSVMKLLKVMMKHWAWRHQMAMATLALKHQKYGNSLYRQIPIQTLHQML